MQKLAGKSLNSLTKPKLLEMSAAQGLPADLSFTKRDLIAQLTMACPEKRKNSIDSYFEVAKAPKKQKVSRVSTIRQYVQRVKESLGMASRAKIELIAGYTDEETGSPLCKVHVGDKIFVATYSPYIRVIGAHEDGCGYRQITQEEAEFCGQNNIRYDAFRRFIRPSC